MTSGTDWISPATSTWTYSNTLLVSFKSTLMNSIIINQQGSHKVKGNGFWKFAEYIYSVIRDAASDILHGTSVLVCVVLAVALLSSCGGDKDEPTTPPTPTPTDITISGLENLRKALLQVDQEVDLLNWITFWNWASLVKVKIEMDWQTKEISDPYHYVPQYPWICNIVLTVKDNKGATQDYRVDNVTIKPLQYQSMSITNIKPVEILPIIWQVQAWDKNVYSHIEHLRIAEVTRIRDMMWKYGAGSHSPAEYQQLMCRLNTGMTSEQPKWYDNYETIWSITGDPSNHAHKEWYILNTLVNHTNFQIWEAAWIDVVKDIIQETPNKIYIFWNSSHWEGDKSRYLQMVTPNKWKNLSRLPNFIIFVAWWNIEKPSWVLKNKIYHEDISWDEHWVYSLASASNGKNNSEPNNHLIVTIWTNANGNIDQTNEIYESSKFPVWFYDNNLFAWRAFPAHSSASWKIEGESWKYATSYTNYVNVAMADLCFQMFAEVQDADQLLNMIRTSTDLRDHIRFNWEDQPLILMSPAWFFKKYCMPTELPNQINAEETISLNKWYYKWVIFDIPWAEVKVNWQWIAYNDANKSVIKGQNPFSLEWRINGDLCRKMGYKWKAVAGKVIVVDDKWNGLNISSDFNVNIQ